MELNSPHREVHVAYGHYFPFRSLSRDFQAVRQNFFLEDEGMISRCFERIWKAREKFALVMVNRGGLAVHETFRPDDLATEMLADALMAKAHAEQGLFARKGLDDGEADSSLIWVAGSRGDDDGVRFVGEGFFWRDGVVPIHFLLYTQFAEVLDEIVGEGVEIVYD